MAVVSDQADIDGTHIVTNSPLPILVGLTRHRWNPVESGEPGWTFQSDSLDVNGIQWGPASLTGIGRRESVTIIVPLVSA